MSHLPSSVSIHDGPASTKAYTHAVQMARRNRAMELSHRDLMKARKILKARRLVKISKASRREQWG